MKVKLGVIALFVVSQSAYALEIFHKTLEIPESVVRFAPSNSTEVKHAFVTIRCDRSASIWEQLNNGLDHWAICSDLKIDGEEALSSAIYQNGELERIGPNQFRLPKTVVRYLRRRHGTACISIKAEFSDDQFAADSPFADPRDSYSLVSFCSRDKLPSFMPSGDYYLNRRKPWSEIGAVLAQPIPVKLKP